MSSNRLKEKLSPLIVSQLPEFIQNDYETFVTFLEAYYEFLEQDQGSQELLQNIRSYNDIDRSIDQFIEYFFKQYCNDVPRNALFDNKTLIKNIKDLYNYKGSEKSYRLLFKILFDKDMEISYPSSQVLRTSDGKWKQKTSIFVLITVGNRDLVVGNNVTITSINTNSQYSLYVESSRDCITSTGIRNDVFEYFIDNSKNIPINVGDVIEFNNFRGVVVETPVKVTISSPGAGFKVGDILPLTSGTGTATKLKVTKVTSSGGIKNVQFISYGIGYAGEFYNFFTASPRVVEPTTFTFANNAASVTDRTLGFSERGTITKPQYGVFGLFAEDYDGELLGEFYMSFYK